MVNFTTSSLPFQLCSVAGDHGKTLLGTIDYSWLFAYAICMFIRYDSSDIIIIHVHMQGFIRDFLLEEGNHSKG